MHQEACTARIPLTLALSHQGRGVPKECRHAGEADLKRIGRVAGGLVEPARELLARLAVHGLHSFVSETPLDPPHPNPSAEMQSIAH